MTIFKIAVFDGDGIGPEIMAPTVELLKNISDGQPFEFEFNSLEAGAGHYRDHGVALPPQSIAKARECDAILLSAMGLPDVRYADGTECVPQIELRMELDLYAGVRPVFVQPGQDVPLKSERISEIDFVIVRESVEGLFAPSGKAEVIGDTEARETMVITREISEKLFDFAFKLAARRKEIGRGSGTVTCVDKANVFPALAFFRKIFFERAGHFPDLKAETAYVDAMALWMVQRPWDFDVLVTENMFGDILSDLGAGIMGSLGLAPSADIGDEHAVFQPCHGTAPDITGKGIANPMAMILSAAMMLEWLAQSSPVTELQECGERLRLAVSDVLVSKTALTPDLGGSADTQAVASAVLKAYQARLS